MRTAAMVTFLVSFAPVAGAVQPIDVSNDSITCNTLNGVASIAPPLKIGGTATSTIMTVKGLLAGCTVTGLDPVTIVSGKVSGKLEGTSNECITTFVPLSGALTIRWKADKATPLLQRSSTVTIVNATFTGFAMPWAAYGQFSLGVSGVAGAFTGGDNGARSSNVSVTSQDIGEILAECGSPTGLEKQYTGLGQFTLE